MKERRETMPPKLKIIAESLNEAVNEARKTNELSVQEEVLVQLEKTSSTLEQAKKEIAAIVRKR